MPNDRTPRTIVIGAGIAGLTVAYTLAKAGGRVKVLEASGRVGGRMSTDVLNGFVVDRGAQFFSSEYALLLSLAAEHGLRTSIQETSPWSAIVRGGEPFGDCALTDRFMYSLPGCWACQRGCDLRGARGSSVARCAPCL